jgi:hypothetical protein
MPYGTLATLDTLATTQQTVVAYGEDKVFEEISALLDAHNVLMEEKMRDLVERTTDRLRRYGTREQMEMEEIDEYGTPEAQKVTAGANLGFPLRMYGIAVQWTRKFFQNATVAELTAQFVAAQEADVRNLDRAIKQALFKPTNYTFTDRLIDRVELPVKALINADSTTVPLGPNGEVFDGATHTHYLANATLTEAAVESLLETVVEHYATGQVMLYINRAQEAGIRAMTGSFTAYLDTRIIPGSGVTRANGALDQTQLYNRAIGIFDQAEVWVKPWVPANYLLAWVKGAPKPLAYRERNAGSGNFMIAFEDEVHPLRARAMEREFGIAVNERTSAAILEVGDGTYTEPTF